MSSFFNLENLKHKCRVCLTPNNQMIALTCKLEEENDGSPEICDALENIFSTKVDINSNYPEGVCLTCFRKIKISYGLKTTFKKSQHILEKYVSVLNLENTDNAESHEKVESCLGEDEQNNLETSTEDIKQEYLEDEEYTIKEELLEEVLPLSDYVIVQVTDDNEEENDIKKEQDDTEDEEQVEQYEDLSKKITAEFLDPHKHKIRRAVCQPKPLYNCPFCKKSMLTKRHLDQHTRICQKYPLEKCEFCDQQFSTLMRKYYHMRTKHSTNALNETKCHICDEVFENVKARSYHIKTKHALKRFACKICGKAFHFKHGLTTHMDTHTKDQYKEICPECGKGFHYRGGLFYHMKIHRGERNYLCSYCDARFLNVSGLNKHIRIHTGEKPCQCEYCGKSFRSTSILNKHEMTHTGQRPHNCTYCGKGFISTYNLKVHMAGHGGDHPCMICDRSFLNEEVLSLHMKYKHNVKEGAKIDGSE